jgi:DnaJ homolog subfamily B member 12
VWEDVYQDENTKQGGATKCTPEQRKAVMDVQNCRKKDYYRILGLEEWCSEQDIKKAYHRGSLKTHPDKNKHPGAGKAFNS